MTHPIRVSLVVAMARNGTIGNKGAMPWTMKSDLRWFKSITLGKPVVMGRKTFEAIGKPLPGRTNIVITRKGDYAAEGALVVHGLERAIRIAEMDARQNGKDELCIIGGGEIYREVLDRAGRLYLTLIDADIEGDTTFPDLNRDAWHITEAALIEKSDTDDYAARIEVWARSVED